MKAIALFRSSILAFIALLFVWFASHFRMPTTAQKPDLTITSPTQWEIPADFGLMHAKDFFLFRGVNSTHPMYDYALMGIAMPLGGHANVMAHVNGNTKSIYTSWTLDPATAIRFATELQGTKSEHGVILVTTYWTAKYTDHEPIPTLQFSPYGEYEYLIPGPYHGCAVIPISRAQSNISLYKQAKEIMKLLHNYKTY